MTAGEPLLAVERLTKRYGDVVALNDVSFNITDGITGILGENGAGKSTAIKILLGLMQPTSGSATVLGENASKSVAARARVGYMPEHDCLPRQVSAAEFLTHMAEVSGLPPSSARTRAADTLRHVGLFEERYRAIGGYSTGMKQRVKLGQALVHDPAFVMLDEPTAGLDPAGREDMLTLIRKTHREFGISVLFSSHLMADIERTCDRIIVLQGGRLVQSGEVQQFTKETETVFIEVDANREALMAALEKRGVVVTVDGTGLTIEGPDESVFDIGYQRYTDAREGRGRARLAVFKDGLRIALGLGRGPRAKILPWFFIVVLSVIGLVFAIVAGAANRLGGPGTAERANLPSHSDYYGIASIIVFVFAAVVAPELLCRDRRDGVINLYLVRPITGSDYVISRWAAFLSVTVVAAWLPQIILFLGLSAGDPLPLQYLQKHWLDVPRFLAAGAAMALYATTLAMLTASFTTRRPYASVFLVGLFVITTP